jgi:hypothetical protein
VVVLVEHARRRLVVVEPVVGFLEEVGARTTLPTAPAVAPAIRAGARTTCRATT